MNSDQNVDDATYAAFLNSAYTSSTAQNSIQSQVSSNFDIATPTNQFSESSQPTQSTQSTQPTQPTQLTQPTQSIIKPARKKPLLLTKDEDIKLLQLLLLNATTYGVPKMTTVWWNNITKKFNRWMTRGVATNLARHVAKLIREQELQIEMLVIDDKDKTGLYIQTIDEWIIIHKNHEDENNIKKKTIEEQQMKDKKAQEKRAE